MPDRERHWWIKGAALGISAVFIGEVLSAFARQPPPPPPPPPGPVTLTLGLDRFLFAPGATMPLTIVAVSGASPLANFVVSIMLDGVFNTTATTLANGSITKAIAAPSSIGAHTVAITSPFGGLSQLTFNVQ